MDFAINSSFNDTQKHWDISIEGEIDIYNSNNFKKELSELIQSNPTDVYVNCEKLEYIDSTGLGALVSILKKVKQYNGDIHLFNLKANVAKLFKITDLNKVFIIEGEPHE